MNKKKLQETIKQDFHGSKDFYQLFIIAAKSLIKKMQSYGEININGLIKQLITIDSIEINYVSFEFGQNGETSLEKIKRILKKNRRIKHRNKI